MSGSVKAAASIDAGVVAAVLAEIAGLAAETIELGEVFDRVATSVRRVIPFDDMAVVRIVDGDRVVLHATTLRPRESGGGTGPYPLTAWSPRWRPCPLPYRRIDDAQAELDPTFPMDAEVLKKGLGSGLWEPFHQGNSFVGGVWLYAHATHAFGEEHQKVLRPIAALLGSAVEHWRMWDTERRRQERLDQLEVVLQTLSESLDIREVFDRISEVVRPILPHDLLGLTEFDLRTRTAHKLAYAGAPDAPPPTGPIPLTEEETRQLLNSEIFVDLPAQIAPVTDRNRIYLRSGRRSLLRVPVLLWGEVRASLVFLHREPGRYGAGDIEVAARLADRIALALSHQRLAEEARVAAEARERAERLEATVESLRRELEIEGRRRVVGVSRSWNEVLLQVGRVASSDTTVLITGESGTGKEVVSRLIHNGSHRTSKPFVAINCAALPDELLESELFGHEKGAFTGAVATMIGRIEQTAGGTLFLDEVAEMSPRVQAKFLRVLEEREYQRLGGTRTLKADLRVVAATNRDLGACIEQQSFREDLFYRLNVFQIHVPSLRERTEDILPMAEAFVEDLRKTMGRPAVGISPDAREKLLAYRWPGNVRELRNAIERAILLCDGSLITRDHLPTPMVVAPGPAPSLGVNGSSDAGASLPPEGVNLEDVERHLLEMALRQARGNKSKAARLLGLTRAQVYSRVEKYRLE